MYRWKMYPSMVDACINPPANWVCLLFYLYLLRFCISVVSGMNAQVSQMAFPAGILQPPFFHKDWYGLDHFTEASTF